MGYAYMWSMCEDMLLSHISKASQHCIMTFAQAFCLRVTTTVLAQLVPCDPVRSRVLACSVPPVSSAFGVKCIV